MIRVALARFAEKKGAPRIRGDDPYEAMLVNLSAVCSPHPRG